MDLSENFNAGKREIVELKPRYGESIWQWWKGYKEQWNYCVKPWKWLMEYKISLWVEFQTWQICTQFPDLRTSCVKWGDSHNLSISEFSISKMKKKGWKPNKFRSDERKNCILQDICSNLSNPSNLLSGFSWNALLNVAQHTLK